MQYKIKSQNEIQSDSQNQDVRLNILFKYSIIKINISEGCVVDKMILAI